MSSPPLLGYLWRAALAAVAIALLGYLVGRSGLRTLANPDGTVSSIQVSLIVGGISALIACGIYAYHAWYNARELAIDPATRTLVVAGERARYDDVVGVTITQATQSHKMPGGRLRTAWSAAGPRRSGTVHVVLRSGRVSHRPFRVPLLARTMPERDARLIADVAFATGAHGGHGVLAAFAREYGWAPPVQQRQDRPSREDRGGGQQWQAPPHSAGSSERPRR